MTEQTRKMILRVNAVFLLVAGVSGFLNDLRGVYTATGPLGRILVSLPDAGIGFIEAHGLAVILGVLLWRAEPLRSWHLTAAAIHVLLGGANLAFWQLFITADILAVGYITTLLHGLFVVLQLFAATTAKPVAIRPA